jgi:hypothetical protein
MQRRLEKGFTRKRDLVQLNRTWAERMQRGFQQASAEILQMFDKAQHKPVAGAV